MDDVYNRWCRLHCALSVQTDKQNAMIRFSYKKKNSERERVECQRFVFIENIQKWGTSGYCWKKKMWKTIKATENKGNCSSSPLETFSTIPFSCWLDSIVWQSNDNCESILSFCFDANANKWIEIGTGIKMSKRREQCRNSMKKKSNFEIVKKNNVYV